MAVNLSASGRKSKVPSANGSRSGPRLFKPPPIDREITIAEGITVKELSEKLGVKANLVVKKLVEKKIFATINQTLDVKLAEATCTRVRSFHQPGQL